MPINDQGTTYGNLYAYKLYTRPTARRLFGSYSFRRKATNKHQENVQRMLEILSLNGSLTTWGMAKSHLSDNTTAVRTKEKEYRRLLVGRRDRGKKTMGVMDVGLVVRDGKSHARGPSDMYRLSLHGILYCLDVLDLSNKQMDTIASKYSQVLPHIFGRWDYLKSIIGEDVYRLKLLASGLFLDNVQTTKMSKFPVYEILTYISVKYQNNFEYITEKDLADQISYWFYTNLLLSSKPTSRSKESHLEMRTWKKIFSGDGELKKWYYGFLDEAIQFYEDRFRVVKNLNMS
ncbi:MAG: hypothetical protein ACREBB_08500 [Nitrosotalea sp.]